MQGDSSVIRHQWSARACGYCGSVFYPDRRPDTGHPFNFCSAACRQKGRPHKRISWEDLFWSHVVVGCGCWAWTGAHNADGYGTFHGPDGAYMGAHTASWVIHFGPVPGGQEVCHNCPDGDAPGCPNPAHLFTATHAENIKDMWGKGRGYAKLTYAIASEIRERYAQGGITGRRLGAEYGVSFSQISRIIRGERWGEQHQPFSPTRREKRILDLSIIK